MRGRQAIADEIMAHIDGVTA